MEKRTMTDDRLTALAKSEALGMGAHLVGVANIERWENCPELMSPKGIMPTARSVLVCGLHHTDGMIEMGGESSPHDQGSYSYQMLMNFHLDVISYTMARYFEDEGYRAIPISASNIWRYRPYKTLSATFAPDMSHIYASVAAGLSELGYNGLAMTPEYGARNRFVSIITDAPLTPTPLLPGNTLCDRCGMCVKTCPTLAFTKEVNGEVSLEIEGHRYTRADKNLWRCAWAEHFGLSVDADIPDRVDEESIIDNVKAIGLRGGTMGCCLKYCLPKDKRSWDPSYSKAPVRRKAVRPAGPSPERGVQEKLVADAIEWGADSVMIESVASWQRKGVDLKALLPDAESLMLIHVASPPTTPRDAARNQTDFSFTLSYLGQKCAFFAASELERLGYSAAPYTLGGMEAEPGHSVAQAVAAYAAEQFGEGNGFACFLVTSAQLPPRPGTAGATPGPSFDRLTERLKTLARESGADLVGVSSAQRLDAVVDQLTTTFDGELILHARDAGRRWLDASADVGEDRRRIQGPADHLKGAKSVIVLGMRMPAHSVERVTRSPAEAIGPYAFATYQSQRQLRLVAIRLIRELNRAGMSCTATYDLCGTGSLAANPRGEQPNAFCNRFAAVSAGLGTLTRGGFVRNPVYGANVRYLAIVVDAELDEDPLADLAGLRQTCDQGCTRCVDHCTVNAFASNTATIRMGDRELTFAPIRQVRCDWALRYGLVPEEGVKFTGSLSNAPIPEEVTVETLADGMTKQDTILKMRPCVAEMCMMACPYVRSQSE
ncbi:MAG: hypothetical protein K9N51_05225 [Candidatus Pacebacteria bacterium]|nr:hypothetical protein [Candidatus Paceibacterota bacterium]